MFGGLFFPKGTKIFLYQHSAVGRDIVKEIFESLGAKVFAPDIKIDDEPVADSQDRAREMVRIGIEKVIPKLVKKSPPAGRQVSNPCTF